MKFVAPLLAAAVQAGTFNSNTWVIHLEEGWPPYSYIDERGNMAGFHKELALQVCRAGLMDCRIAMGTPTQCFEKTGYAGAGINDKWYDGCAGWSHTISRVLSTAFTEPWPPVYPGAFLVKSGNEVNANGAGQTVGVINGWSTNDACIARHGYDQWKEVKHIINEGDNLAKAVRDGTVDALFYLKQADNSYLGDTSGLTFVNSPEIPCLLGGFSVATRKDSQLEAAWNTGFDKLVESGEYDDLCAQWADKGVECI